MGIETDTERLMFLETAGFGVDVSYKGLIVKAIFDNETIEIDTPGFVQMLKEEPTVTLRTSDIASIAEDDTMIIEGVTYKVREWRHDGTGFSTVRLEKQ